MVARPADPTGLLLEAGRRLSSEIELDRALDALGSCFVPTFADWCGVHLVEPDGDVRFAATYHRDAALTQKTRAFLARSPVPIDAPVGLGRTLRTGQTEVIDDFPLFLGKLSPPPASWPELDACPAQSVAYVALRASGHVVGAVTLAREAPGRPFVADEVRLIEDVATRAAGAVENARLVAELREREERLRSYNDALVRLARLTIHGRGDLAQAARAIVEESSRALDVERVSVWVYDAGRTAIRCLDLFERTAGRHSSGLALSAQAFPAYFEALAEERAIAAHDARTDPRTAEFTTSYLDPHGITSMLDAPLRVGGSVVGVLCHEHVGAPRRWRPEEEIFAGALAGLVSLVLETERRGQEQGKLIESETRFTRLADEAPIGIWLTDAELRNTFNNRWRCLMLGCASEDLQGDGWRERVHPEDLAREFARTRADVEARRAFQTQHRLRKADGTWFHVLNVASPRFDADGRFLGYIGAEFDITDRVEAQKALAEARRDLARGERLAAMGSLVTGVAHEIRTPLAYIANHAALLRSRVPPDALASLDAIQEGVDRVNALVTDLRRFTREAEGPRAPERLHELAASAARLFEATHRGGVRLALDLQPTPPVPLDANRVQQVVLNLLENAADVSPAGRTVHLSTGPAEGWVELRVRDEGPGIPADVQARMFEPFFTTKPEGTGLGLAIVRRIVESHRGRIEVDSAPGRGSTFIVSFPPAP